MIKQVQKMKTKQLDFEMGYKTKWFTTIDAHKS